MNITVNVDTDNLDLTTPIGTQIDEEGDSAPYTLGDAVANKLALMLISHQDSRGIKGIVNDERTAIIRARVAEEIEAALTEPFTPMNHYGEKSGKPTTLREQIARIAADAVKIDERNAYSRQPTAFEKLVREQINKALTEELAKLLAEEKAKVVAAVRAKASELLAQAVKEQLR